MTASETETGPMEIGEQVATYRAFNGLVKWGSLFVAALVLFMTLFFSAGAGLLPSAIVTVILLAAGIAVLKRRASAR